MPKKKQQPKNAFYFFMKDYKEEQEQMGHYFRGGMKEVADVAGPAWKELPPGERAPYEERAAQHRQREKGNLENKFTTTGISYAQLAREQEEAAMLRERMRREVEGTVQALDRDSTLKTHTFYCVHFNYYCRTEDGSYLICEVAIAQFNLKDGVREVYHTIIRQDRIPTGYSFESKSTSEETHQIPLPQDLETGEPYNGNLFIYIRSFLEQSKMRNGSLPPLYTIDAHIDVAQDALNRLAEHHNPQDPELFRVYPLSKLFFLLRNAAAPADAPGFPVQALAERELDKDQYNFAPGIACEMHETNDTCVYCSRSVVQRWVFLVCDHCCRDLGIPMERGQHVPINAAIRTDMALPADSQFQRVTKKSGRNAPKTESPRNRSTAGNAPSAQTARAPPRPKPQSPQSPPRPVQLLDHSKIAPSEELTHTFNINPTAAPIPPPSRQEGGNCWGIKTDGPRTVLRKPMSLPPSIAKDLKFTESDFPDLGGSFRTQAAVAGRGARGRARMLLEEGPPAPGGLQAEKRHGEDGGKEDEDEDDDGDGGAWGVMGAGRGRGRPSSKPMSRLAANLQGLNFE